MKISRTKIDILMAERGMKRKELAKRCGMTAQNMSTIILRGTCYPQTAGKIAESLGVRVAEIIDEEKE